MFDPLQVISDKAFGDNWTFLSICMRSCGLSMVKGGRGERKSNESAEKSVIFKSSERQDIITCVASVQKDV